MSTEQIQLNIPCKDTILQTLHSEAAAFLRDQGVRLRRNRDDLTPLSPACCGALLLGNLLWQIRNGGWSQWCRNGYVLHLDSTRAAAAAIDTELSARVVDMLDALKPHINLGAEFRGFGGSYFILTADEREIVFQGGDVMTAGETLCGLLNRDFYRFDKAWEQEVIAWLEAGAPDFECGAGS